MGILKNPNWINWELADRKRFEDVSEVELNTLKSRLESVISTDQPVVSVCIAAWNEELNIIKCLDSISRNKTKVPFEIVVINNNSTDRTQDVLDSLPVKSFFQPIQGCGISRQLGQEKARGEYILSADADCYYPEHWIETMYEALKRDNTGAVYSRHSFLGHTNMPRWKYWFYELGKDFIIDLRSIKRPYLNAYGMSLGYRRELGLKEGFVTRNIRGEDGRLCFDLMKYGKIRLVRSNKVRIWTSDRNLEKDGSLFNAVKKRILRELFRMRNYFTNPEPHDTKTSENTELSTEEYKEALKSKLKLKKTHDGRK